MSTTRKTYEGEDRTEEEAVSNMATQWARDPMRGDTLQLCDLYRFTHPKTGVRRWYAIGASQSKTTPAEGGA